MKNKTLVLNIGVLFALLWLISWWLNASLSIFVSDTGLRFIQIRQLIENRWQTLSVSYPGRVFDPELAHVPYYFAYAVLDNDIFLSITPFVPILSSVGYVVGGVPGMMLPIVAAGVFTAVAIYQLALLCELPNPLLILWASVFATPMFFYSVELWDHSLAVACATWSVYLIARGLRQQTRSPLFFSGILAGIGLGQRPEMYMFVLCLAVGLFAVDWRRVPFLLTGGLAGTLPIWWWQYQQVGHPLGLALASNLFRYGLPEQFAVASPGHPWFFRFGRKLFYVNGQDLISFTAVLLILIGLLLFIMTMRVEKWQTKRAFGASAALLVMGYFLYVVLAVQPTALNGVLTVFPLLPFALLFQKESTMGQIKRPIYRLVWVTTMLFLVGMALIWPAYGGLQWGSRYILPFFPMAIYLAFYHHHLLRSAWVNWRRNALDGLFRILLLTSIGVQIAGFYMQAAIHQENGIIRDGVAALPVSIVVTNSAYLPAESASLAEKTFLYAADSAALETLIPRFWEEGLSEFAVLPLNFVPLPVPERVGKITLQEIQPFVYQMEQE